MSEEAARSATTRRRGRQNRRRAAAAAAEARRRGRVRGSPGGVAAGGGRHGREAGTQRRGRKRLRGVQRDGTHGTERDGGGESAGLARAAPPHEAAGAVAPSARAARKRVNDSSSSITSSRLRLSMPIIETNSCSKM